MKSNQRFLPNKKFRKRNQIIKNNIIYLNINNYGRNINKKKIYSESSSKSIAFNKESTKKLYEKKGNLLNREYSDFELNQLEYEKAIKLDKRTFCRLYCAQLKREHLIFFTFFNCDDYNLLSVKVSRSIFLMVGDMALNVFFFSDESMHKIFLNYGKYNFIQQIPQIIYTTIISQLIEIFLCYLSLTDKYIYQIKKRTHNFNKKEIMKILKCIKIKLVVFFIFTFIFFVFYWYTVTTFCAVYENTQITFIKDSLLSFLLSILYPFIIYLIPSALRIITLKNVKINLKCIYKLSDIIPFF